MFVFDMRKSTKKERGTEKRAAKEMAATAKANDCEETKLFFCLCFPDSSLKHFFFSTEGVLDSNKSSLSLDL